ncbi:hypothetical protein NE237_009508 [Protea cynaroides]|uniref:Uncharacterized protein n=1 Tax=Protea cynaroides TaxID=273540 RepID=A0A9Q0KXL0_9MAGN|nr:hypothetical protein NE237_009508 [Protea cynaroides]
MGGSSSAAVQLDKNAADGARDVGNAATGLADNDSFARSFVDVAQNHPSNVENTVPVIVQPVTIPMGNGGEGNNAQNSNMNSISKTVMGSASLSRRVFLLDIADKEDEQNDLSTDVDESDLSHHEDGLNKGDVDPNEVSTINGLGGGQVTSTELGIIFVSYNEVEK